MKPAIVPPDAARFVSGKSAHELLAMIGYGRLPEGLTPEAVGKADVDRVAVKAARRADRQSA